MWSSESILIVYIYTISTNTAAASDRREEKLLQTICYVVEEVVVPSPY